VDEKICQLISTLRIRRVLFICRRFWYFSGGKRKRQNIRGSYHGKKRNFERMENAMTKEQLIEMGLTEEQATKVMEQLDGNFVTKTRFNEVNEDLKKVKESLKERDGQLDKLKKSTNVDDLKGEIEKLQTANKKKDEDHAAEIKAVKIESALESALVTAKAKNTKAVKALLDLKDVELAEDGTIKGLADQIKKLTESEDTSFLFDVETVPGSTPKFTPKGVKPAESGSKTPDGKVDFTKMSYEELAAFMDANPNADIPEAPLIVENTQNHS